MARNQDFLKAWPNDNLKHIQIQSWDNSKATFWRNNVINSLLVQVVFIECHGKGNRYPHVHSQLSWYCCQLKIKAHPRQHMSITPARRNISLVTMATIGINGSAYKKWHIGSYPGKWHWNMKYSWVFSNCLKHQLHLQESDICNEFKRINVSKCNQRTPPTQMTSSCGLQEQYIAKYPHTQSG